MHVYFVSGLGGWMPAPELPAWIKQQDAFKAREETSSVSEHLWNNWSTSGDPGGADFQDPLNLLGEPATDYTLMRDLINEVDLNTKESDFVAIIGFSLGGDVALKVAQKLAALGKEIDVLATIDPVAIGSGPNGNWDPRAGRLLGNRWPLFDYSVPSNVRYFFNRWQTNYAYPLDRLSAHIPVDAQASKLADGKTVSDQVEQNDMKDADGALRYRGCTAPDYAFGYCKLWEKSTSRTDHGLLAKDLWVTEELKGVFKELLSLPAPKISIDAGDARNGIAGLVMDDGQDQVYRWNVRGDFKTVHVTVTRDGVVIHDEPEEGAVGEFDYNDRGLGEFKFTVVADGFKSTKDVHTITVSDDDSAGPLISIDGSSGGILDSQVRGYSWSMSDPSGLAAKGVEVTGPTGRLTPRAWVSGDAPATGQFDLTTHRPGKYQINIGAYDADDDRTSDTEESHASRTVTVVDDDDAEPLISFFANDGTFLLDDSRRETHGITNAIAWNVTDVSGLASVTASLFQNGALVRTATVAANDSFALDPYGPGEFKVVLVATDADNDGWLPYQQDGVTIRDQRESTASVTLTVTNDPPDVFAGGPYTVEEGQLLYLSATATDVDPGDAATLTYGWDFNGDDNFSDATGPAPTVGWETLVAAGIADDGMYTIRVRATDFYGKSDDDEATVSVTNGAPQVESIHADSVIHEDAALTITGKYVDPSPVDTHQVRVYWGDGTNSLATVDSAARTFVATRHFADDNPTATQEDEFIIRVEVIDDEGAVNPPSSRVVEVVTETDGAIELPAFQSSLPAEVSGRLTSAQVTVDPQTAVSTTADGLAFEHRHSIRLHDSAGLFSFGEATTTSASAVGLHQHLYDVDAAERSFTGTDRSLLNGAFRSVISSTNPTYSGVGDTTATAGHDHTSGDVNFSTSTTFYYSPSAAYATDVGDLPIVNPSANYAATSAPSPYTDWKVINESVERRYYGSDYGYGPEPYAPGPVGIRYFYGGSDSLAHMYQVVAVPASSRGAIDAGTARAYLSAYMGGWRYQEDYAQIRIYFYDGNRNVLSYGGDLRGPTAAERGSQTKLMYRDTWLTIPGSTRYIELDVRFFRVSSGTTNDAYLDDMRLKIFDFGEQSYSVSSSTLNGYTLPSFDTTRGSLNSARVTVNPTAAWTAEANGGQFEHKHEFQLTMPYFSFPASISSSGLAGEDHGHTVNFDQAQATFLSEEDLQALFGQSTNVVLEQDVDSHMVAPDGHTHDLVRGTVPFRTTTTFTYDVASTKVRVQNQDPQITDLVLPAAISENTTVTLSGTFIDAGQADSHRIQIDWGDGRQDELPLPLGARSFSFSHQYDDDDPSGTSSDLLDVVVTVLDDDGGQDLATLGLLLKDEAPVLAIAEPLPVAEGSIFSLPQAVFTDHGLLDTHSAVVDWGDATSATTAVIVQGAGGGVVVDEHIYRDEGLYPGLVMLTDDDAGEAFAPFTVSVYNVAPRIRTLEVAGPVIEGAALTLRAAATDAGDDILTYTWDFGDDSPQVTGVGIDSVPHVYATEGVYTATLIVDDGDGGVASRQLTIIVPDISTGVMVAGPATSVEGESYSLTLSTLTSEAASAIDHWTVHWDDGTTESFSADGIVSHVYLSGPATREIRVETTNTSGVTSLVGQLPVIVLNAAPEIVSMSSSDLPASEGESMPLVPRAYSVRTHREGGALYFSAEAVDAGGDQLTYTWNFGDGSQNQSGINLKNIVHAFADNGAYFVTLTVDDGEGGMAAAMIPVLVVNVAPTIDLSGAPSVAEGANYQLTLGAVNDPGDDSVTEWIVDWGDGQTSSYTQGGTVSHDFADGNDTHTIRISLVDEDGYHADVRRIDVAVLNADPMVERFTGADGGLEGQRLSLSADASDPAGAHDVLTYRWNFGDESPEVSGVNLSNVFHAYADDGQYTLTLTVTDEDGGSTTATQPIVIRNVAPSAAISGPPTTREAQPYELRFGSIIDPGGDTVTEWIVDWGDGHHETLVDPMSATHTYADGPHASEIRLTLVDEDGVHSPVAVLPIWVLNAAPTVAALTGDDAGLEGDPLTFTATAGDPAGLTDPLTYHWDFGDGSPTVSGRDLALVSHAFTDDGVYTVQVTVDDGDGGYQSRGMRVVVANVAPTIALDGVATTVEGSVYSLGLGVVTEPGDDVVTQWIVDWGDGFSDSFASDGTAQHAYADGPAAHQISVSLVDEDGTHLNAGVLMLTVENGPPVIDSVSHSPDPLEGVSIAFSAGTSDPGDDGDALTYTWDFGDGSAIISSALPDRFHTYVDDGVYDVRITVADGDGGEDFRNFQIAVANASPTIQLAGAPSVSEASLYELTLGEIDDPGQDTVTEWIVTWGDGTEERYSAGGVVSHTYPDGPQNLTLTVSLVDEDGTHVAASQAVLVRNSSPVINALAGDVGGDEGDPLFFTAAASDAAGAADPLMYSWDFGDGSETVSGIDLTSISHTFADDGEFLIELTVDDGDGGTSSEFFAVSVNNVDPRFEAGDDQVLLPPVAGFFSRTGIAFTDPGTDVWSGTVNYQDGTGEWPLVIDQQTKTFNLAHTFVISGVFDVAVVVQDDEGGRHTDTFKLEVILNTPPTAYDDSLRTSESVAVLFNVLDDNGEGADSDAEDNIVPHLTQNLTSPTRGRLTNHQDGSFTFDPNSDFEYLGVGDSADETFTYQITDAFGETDTATVKITIIGENDAPTIDSVYASVTVNEGAMAENQGSFQDLDLTDNVTVTASIGSIIQDAGHSGSWRWYFDTSDGPDQSQEVTLTATDQQGASHSILFSLKVNNVPPTFDAASQNAIFEVIENSVGGTHVGVVAARDPGDDTLVYSITGGSGATVFAIDHRTGAIRVADSSQLDFETIRSFSLELKVVDDEGESNTTSVAVNLLNQASVTGTVFVDVDQNGRYDAYEMGVDSVLVELLAGNGDVLQTTITSDGGFYLFEDLDPGTYRVHEVQPTGVDDGEEQVGSLGGLRTDNDTLQFTLERTDATDYIFAELGQQVTNGDTAGIGFWQNKHGQELIALGGAALADWLTVNFSHVFGDRLVGADGAHVAAFYKDQLFKQKSSNAAGPAKVDAQFMALALAAFFTSRSLAGQVAVSFGFHVSDTGIGTKLVNVGTRGAAFDTADNSERTIMQLLWAVDDLTDAVDNVQESAWIYDSNGDGIIDDGEAELRRLANELFGLINEGGSI